MFMDLLCFAADFLEKTAHTFIVQNSTEIKKYAQKWGSNMDNIREYGTIELDDEKSGKHFLVISIIGEIEGHNSASEKVKTTKYEHLLPMLVSIEGDEDIDGIRI